MNRDIKFRAFVSKNNRYKTSIGMIEPERIQTMLNPKYSRIPAKHCWDEMGLVLMQYTGLQDKNEVEIYESDIMLDNEFNRKYTVIFENGMFFCKSKDNRFFYFNEQFIFEAIEVIGNIYENTELL